MLNQYPLLVARRFSANLAAVREESGLSQEDVAWLAELHRTQIGNLERGGRVPRIDTLVKLVGTFDLPLECPLLDGITWRPARHSPGDFEISPPTKKGPGACR